MGIWQRLLLVPVLAPLLAVLLVAGLNPGPRITVRLLIWTSPPLPLGLWLAIAAGGGAALSAGATDLALRQGRMPRRRQVVRPGGAASEREEERSWRRPWPRDGGGGRGDWAEAAGDGERGPAASWPGRSAGPQRPPGEPAPTVAVPFRVVRRGRPARGSAPAEPAQTGRATAGAAASGSAAAESPVRAATASDQDWGVPLADDW